MGDGAYRIPICLKTMRRPKTFITCHFYFFFLATTSRSAQVIGKNHIQIYKNIIYKTHRSYIHMRFINLTLNMLYYSFMQYNLHFLPYPLNERFDGPLIT